MTLGSDWLLPVRTSIQQSKNGYLHCRSADYGSPQVSEWHCSVHHLVYTITLCHDVSIQPSTTMNRSRQNVDQPCVWRCLHNRSATAKT